VISATRPPRRSAAEDAVPACPYVGLLPFDEGDAEFFFGRENEIELIAANLVAARLTLLYAPSGVGKTSVLRAGVVPQLHRIGEEDDDLGLRRAAVAYVRDWSGPPLQTVTGELCRALRATGASVEGPASGEPLGAWLRGLPERASIPVAYLILDQFEEYFLYHPGDEELPGELGEVLAAGDLNVRVLLSIREDALAALDRFEGHVPHLLENYFRLAHLDRESARAAIQGPLERYNQRTAPGGQMSVEPELVEALLEQVRAGRVQVGEETNAPDRLGPADRSDVEAPYLQLVLTRLWEEERARGSTVLRRDTLTKLGGAQAIVQSHLDAVMAGLSPQQVQVAAAVFTTSSRRPGARSRSRPRTSPTGPMCRSTASGICSRRCRRGPGASCARSPRPPAPKGRHATRSSTTSWAPRSSTGVADTSPRNSRPRRDARSSRHGQRRGTPAAACSGRAWSQRPWPCSWSLPAWPAWPPGDTPSTRTRRRIWQTRRRIWPRRGSWGPMPTGW
jgi:hypothetical protein